MKNFSLKALGAFIFAAGLVVAGVAAPAHAATDIVSASKSMYSGTVSNPVFLYGAPTESRPRVNFMERNSWANTYYVKFVGVTTTVQSCTPGTYNIGSFSPSGATVAAGFPTSTPGTSEWATSCGISSSGSGASSSVTFNFDKTPNAVMGSGAQLVVQTGVLSVDPNATDVKAYVSDDNATWDLIATTTTIGYAITLNANGGSKMYGQSGTTTNKVSGTSSWTAISETFASFVWGGHTFDGWTTDPQGTNTLYATGTSVPLSTSGPTTLYAKWTTSVVSPPSTNVPNNNVPGNNQNITPCMNGTGNYMLQVMGGSGATTSGGAGDCIFKSTQAATVAPSNVFTKAGYTFTGWKTTQNVPVAVGASVTASMGSPTQLNAVWVANGSVSNTPRPSASLALSVGIGSRAHSANVPISASGLKPGADYVVEVHSTPTRIARGTVANDGTISDNTGLIPANLELGWHKIVLTSTDVDGNEYSSTYWFKIAGDGTLLSTSETIPAELANTGINTSAGISLLAGGLSLALVGAEMFMISRRKRSN